MPLKKHLLKKLAMLQGENNQNNLVVQDYHKILT